MTLITEILEKQIKLMYFPIKISRKLDFTPKYSFFSGKAAGTDADEQVGIERSAARKARHFVHSEETPAEGILL